MSKFYRISDTGSGTSLLGGTVLIMLSREPYYLKWFLSTQCCYPSNAIQWNNIFKAVINSEQFQHDFVLRAENL